MEEEVTAVAGAATTEDKVLVRVGPRVGIAAGVVDSKVLVLKIFHVGEACALFIFLSSTFVSSIENCHIGRALER